jgi:phospholipid/cholesterol/gamma-HCH transport system substrate-binding protein
MLIEGTCYAADSFKVLTRARDPKIRMKRKTTINNLKLGLFVLAGVVFLVFSLYMIGQNKNLFGATFTISTYFRNINGLVAGNNVRFSGIDVGTVKSVTVENDTSVLLVLMIDRNMKDHIKINAVASLGTDGLVGNRLVNINSVPGAYPSVDEGTVIASRLPVETDEMLRTLQTTNNNIAVITENLKEVSVRLNGSATLWNILADTMIVKDLKAAAKHLNQAGVNTELATGKARYVVDRLGSGNGLANALFTDTVMRIQLEESLAGLKHTSQSLENITGKLKDVLHDSVTSGKITNSILNIEQGTGRFNENMEALKSNFLFRKYFRKQKASKQKPSKN